MAKKKPLAELVAEPVVTHPVAQDAVEEATGLVPWEEPFPTTGKTRVLFLEDHGIGRAVISKGTVAVIDCELAQSLHRSIKGV